MSKHLAFISLMSTALFMSEGVATASAEPAKLDMDQLKTTKYFAPSDTESGVAYLQHVMGSAENIPLHFNFDAANFAPVPGFGLLIRPLTAKNKTKGEPRTLEGIVAAFIPDIATVVASPKGSELLKQIWQEAAARKLTGIVSASSAANEKAILPHDLEGFFERAARGEGLEAFNHKDIGAKAVNTLKKQGLINMDKNILRAVLQSESYAKQNYPKIVQPIWVAIGRQMQKDARALGLNAALYDNWLDNRATTNFNDVDSIDLSAFGIPNEDEVETAAE